MAVLAVSVPATAHAAGFQFAPQAEFATESKPQSIAVADLNADGKPDLVTANSASNNVSVLLGEGAGKFKAQEPYATEAAPSAVAVADLNGDKIPDLVVANSASNNVSVLLGEGGGKFKAQEPYGTEAAPSAVAITDVNGDGIPDLLVANSASNNVSVLLGEGGGKFKAQETYAVEEAPSAVAVADLNADKIPDLVVANSGSNNVSVLLGEGGGKFKAQTPFGTGAKPQGVAVADLNADGKLDLVTANSEGNSASVLLGKGDGTFAAKTDYATGAKPQAVAVADLNADGKPDLVTANSEGNSASVLLGKGDGTFAAKTDYATGAKPQAVAVADLNADGKPDIVTADTEANKVSVLLNASVAVLETSPGSLTFPGTLFGTKSAAQKVTVANGGSAPLAVSAIAVTGNFTASGCTPPLALAPGASCTVTVVFGPKGYEKLTGELTITTTAGAKKIGLSGTGLPPLPTVNTGPVGEITGPYVTLTGSITSQSKGKFYFQYGPTLAYGSGTPTLELKSELNPQLVSASVPLTPGNTYHYRLVATNFAGTSYGRDQAFTVPPEAPLLAVLRHGRLGAVLRHGLRLRVLESSSGTLTLTIFLDARTARAAHLAGRKHRARVAIGTLRVSLKALTAKRVTLSFSRAARRHLADMSRLRLTIEATPFASNGVAGEPAKVALQLRR